MGPITSKIIVGATGQHKATEEKLCPIYSDYIMLACWKEKKIIGSLKMMAIRQWWDHPSLSVEESLSIPPFASFSIYNLLRHCIIFIFHISLPYLQDQLSWCLLFNHQTCWRHINTHKANHENCLWSVDNFTALKSAKEIILINGQYLLASLMGDPRFYRFNPLVIGVTVAT